MYWEGIKIAMICVISPMLLIMIILLAVISNRLSSILEFMEHFDVDDEEGV